MKKIGSRIMIFSLLIVTVTILLIEGYNVIQHLRDNRGTVNDCNRHRIARGYRVDMGCVSGSRHCVVSHCKEYCRA